MVYETNCTEITQDKWRELMKYGRKCSYRMLAARIKRELPELYHALALQFYNPYAEQCRQTPTHYILVHSAIEYFIRKQSCLPALSLSVIAARCHLSRRERHWQAVFGCAG